MKRKLKFIWLIFQLEGTALVWWERKLHDRSKCGNLLSSWLEFKSAIKNQFYPLGYLHKEMKEWKTLRKSKGQTIQRFTEKFRKKSLALKIPLDSYEMLMKYIGTLHGYIHHTFILFNPTNIYEVCVQTTHLENKGKHVREDPTKKPFNLPHKPFEEFKRKENKNSTMTRERGKPSCTHCKKSGHDDEHCWKMHSEKRPNQFGGKGKTKIIPSMQQDLGSD
jgi:hypothetical protein